MTIFEKAKEIFENIENVKPVVHNISNLVTANDCANMTLACGGSPTMAEHPDEVEEITAVCNGFVINMGVVSDSIVDAMLNAGKKNNEIGHPVVLDPVGAGAAKKRNDTLFKLLDNIKFSVIRGNISEIKFIATGTSGAKGVDADENDKVTDKNIDSVIEFAKNLSAKTGAVIAISGAIDIIADSKKAYIIKNGCEMMSRVTGTGCMLSSAVGVFCSANNCDILDACAVVFAAYGYAGELAYKKVVENNEGTGSFRMYLMDYMSNMNYKTFMEGANIEER